MAVATKIATPSPQTEEQWATALAGSLISDALLEAGEPIKASEVVKYAKNPAIDLKLARVILTTNPTMTVVEGNKWTLWTRFSDDRYTVDRTLKTLLDAIPAWQRSAATKQRSPNVLPRSPRIRIGRAPSPTSRDQTNG